MNVSGIAPCLWFDDQAEAASDFYTGLLPASRVVSVARYPKSFDNPANKPRDSVMTVEFELAGTPFTALNGGPIFTPNRSISFFVFTDSVRETDRIASELADDGGQYLMDLGEYPWSARYGWVQDRFGVSWQVMHSAGASGAAPVVPCLMFARDVHGRAEEAIEQYAAVFPGSSVVALEKYDPDEGPAGSLKHGRVVLGGPELAAMDNHLEHEVGFTEGISLQVLCRDQDEVDHYWTTLSDGGEEGPCGWLKDRFGVSWQVVPTAFNELLKRSGGSGAGYDRAFQAMLGMHKLDIAALTAAYDGE